MKSKSASSLPAVTTEEASLTEKELARLEQLEKVVKEGLPYFIKVGLALKEINEKRYYRKHAQTFPEYMESRFGYSSARGYQLIHSAEAAIAVDYEGNNDNYLHPEKLNHGRGNDIIIDNERKARALYGLDPEEQKAVANAAQEKAIKEHKTLSYKDIDIAASKRKEGKTKGGGKDKFVEDGKHIAQSLSRIGEAIKEFISKYSGRKDKDREVGIHIRKLERISAHLEYIAPAGKTTSTAPGTITGTKEWSDSTINCISGCENACKYCYAQGDKIRRKQIKLKDRAVPKRREWKNVFNEFRKIHKNLGGHGIIMFPSTHDITPKTIDYCLETLKFMLAYERNSYKFLIVSKPQKECIKRLCSELKEYKKRVAFRFTIGSADDTVLKFWEPDASSFKERVACVKYAFDHDYKTSVSCEPMLDDNINAVIKVVHKYVTDTIWLGNARLIKTRLNCNGFKDSEHKAAAAKLNSLQTESAAKALYARWGTDEKIKWKDSLKKVLKLPFASVVGDGG